jgi:DNA processing protein
MNNNFDTWEIKLKSPHYPKLLSQIPACPETIFVKGALSDHPKAIAIVGTRRSSQLGKKIAYDFAIKLAQNGCVIVSGLALGIDSAAHCGALDGGGITWAVLPCGIESIYPSTNTKLAQKIIQSGGALISEYPNKTPPYPNQFILRNRIISGLAAAVLIIEAPQNSGALSTAQFAIKQKRPLFVVPGSITSELYKGSNYLIRNGATLVTSPDDLLNDLGWNNFKNNSSPKINFENKIEKIIFDAIKNDGNSLSVDKICQITKLKPQEVSAALMKMTLDGIVVDDGGKYYIAKAK